MLGLRGAASFASLLWLVLPLGHHFVHAADKGQPPTPSAGCPVSGPVLPRPTDLCHSKHIKDATESLTQTLDSAVSGEIKAGWDVQNSSFSIALVSPNGGTAGLPGLGGDSERGIVWEYHHTGERNTNGTKKVDGDSQYLVGSVSKVFSALLLLRSELNLEDPVTKYLPELKGDGSSPIQWGNITLGSLPEHLAGVPPNLAGAFDWYFLAAVYQQLGLPPLEDSDYPKCSVPGLNEACNREQFLEQMLIAQPVDNPYSRPIYSQLSFTLFSLAMSEQTGKNFSQMLDEMVAAPLKLTNTGVSPGIEERAVIPPVEQHGWGADYGLSAPGGGLYSSMNDLSSLITSILDYSVLETPDDVRKWLLPKSMTSSPSTIIGQPWEIQRTTNLDPEHPHTIDIYGKSGGAQGYISQISVIDQYGIGFVLLTAGPLDSPASNIINEAVLSTLVPAIEKEAREQAQVYVGKFASPADAPDDAVPVQMKTSMDKGPGLKLDFLNRNGSDILVALQTMWSYTLPMMAKLNPDFRMYPSGIEKPVVGEEGVVHEEWRISFDALPAGTGSGSELPGQGSLGDLCTSWQTTDWLYYGGESLDKVVFTVDKKAGEVLGVDIPFLRSGVLERKM